MTLHSMKRVCEGAWEKVGGGGCRSRRMRVWLGCRVERRVAVARPIPEEPPVMRIVFGAEERVVKDAVEGWKRDMAGRERDVMGMWSVAIERMSREGP